jgi:pilus assembly protein CpaC
MSLVPRWYSQLMRSRLTFVLALAAVLTIASLGAAEWAGTQALAQNAPVVKHIVVIVNKSKTIRFDKPFKTATIAATAIADVSPITDRALYIQGKTIGTTNISVFDDNMQLAEIIDLEVSIDTENLQRKIRASTGSDAIHVGANGSEVILSGMAPDAIAADRAVSVASKTSQSVTNTMTVAASQQVMLKVRFLEASRSAERDLGVNWFGSNGSRTAGFSTGLGTPNIQPTPSTSTSSTGATTTTSTNTGGISVIQSAGSLLTASGTGTPFGVVLANLVNGGTNIDVMVSALETKGLVRRLAEPNLVALSGDTARFLAGGEFPVPTAVATTTGQGVTPSIEFKKFGVSLAFVPTVLRAGLINLRISPEVSELDFANAVTISGTTIPSLVVRSAQTTVELRDGQSFAIAGLLQNRGIRNIDQIPWLGSVPVLGALFRSSAYQNQETDLVIIVTPHLVRPGSPVDRLASPLDQRLPSNDVDFFVNGQLEVPKKYSDYVTSGGGLQGPYGAIIPVETGSNQPVYKGGVAK